MNDENEASYCCISLFRCRLYQFSLEDGDPVVACELSPLSVMVSKLTFVSLLEATSTATYRTATLAKGLYAERIIYSLDRGAEVPRE